MQLGTPPGAGDGAGQTDLIKDTSSETFMTDVIQASMEGPVIVDFWAPWCGPCRQLTPVLEKVVQAAKGAVRLVKMNIDENPQLAQQLRIQSIPAVYAFRNGRPVDGFMGALPESQIRSFVERLAGEIGPSPVDELLERGAAALEAEDYAGAAQIYAAVLQEEQQNIKALAGLARCYVGHEDLERAEQVLALVPPEGANDPDVLSAGAALDLARQPAADSSEIAALKAALEADPADHEKRFDLSAALNSAGDREGAVNELLEIIRRNRTWNDEAARLQLLKLFDAYGPKDPVTQDGRRRLSAILFS